MSIQLDWRTEVVALSVIDADATKCLEDSSVFDVDIVEILMEERQGDNG